MTISIRSDASFSKWLAVLAAGEVDHLGASNHEEVIRALRRYRDRQAPESFGTMTQSIEDASTKGFHARQENRARQIDELSIARARAANERFSNTGR